MKNKASVIIKQIISALSSIAKAKTMAIKNKTSGAKARLIMFSLLKHKKVIVDSLSDKIHRLLGQHDKESDDELSDESKAIVLYNAMANESRASSSHTHLMVKAEGDEEDDDDDDKYPDLRHSLFDEEDFEEDQGGSVIDMVRNSKEDEGENFVLEDEIDHVADLFITRFHKQMRMQKLLSFKRYQEMMERSL
jgi:hypothetical protein|uniref:Uncharacterized protein n=1 Tax=Fagus sylvatica TaxID=28930 RepID=A0A2N9FWC1_FAGSY